MRILYELFACSLNRWSLFFVYIFCLLFSILLVKLEEKLVKAQDSDIELLARRDK